MPNCPDVRNQYGKYCRDEDSSSMELPTTLVDICTGDFLGSDTTDSRLVAKPISSDVAWNTDLATTRVDAKAAFKGVAQGEIDSEDGVCNARPDGIPIARYRAGSSWTRAYQIVDASGVAEPTTWVRGQGFTFAKNASSNALVNDKIVKSSTAAHIVFKAVSDSGPTSTAYAEVEFSA